MAVHSPAPKALRMRRLPGFSLPARFISSSSTGRVAEDVDFYVLHQANMRILEGVRTRLKVDAARFPHNIERTGNTSSATVPVLLDELNRSGKLKPGAHLILNAFGAGLCTATALVKW